MVFQKHVFIFKTGFRMRFHCQKGFFWNVLSFSKCEWFCEGGITCTCLCGRWNHKIVKLAQGDENLSFFQNNVSIFKVWFFYEKCFHFQNVKGFVSVAYLKWGHYLHLRGQLVKSPYCKVVTCWWKHCQRCLKNQNNTKNVKQLGNCVFNCDAIKLLLL